VSEFRPLVVAQMQGMGVRMDDLHVWASNDAGVWSLLTKALQKWTAFSSHLRDEQVAFSVTDGDQVYALRGAAFSRPMLRLDVVRNDEGYPLVDFGGRLGAVTAREMDRIQVDWAGVSASRPSHWMMEGRTRVRLYPEPDVNYDFTVGGVCLHSALTADDDELEIQPEDEILVARYCAAQWAMMAGQANEALAQASLEGQAAAEACQNRTTRAVAPRRGGIEIERVCW